MRKYKTTQEEGHLILLIDDNREYLRSTERVLRRAGHRVMTAESALAGLDIMRAEPIELVLVDFLMPGMTGEDFVRELRTFNKSVQVILQTGFAAELPPAAMLKKLDVQGYHDKSDGPYKLLLWTDVGLQSARTVRRLEQVRQGLDHILDVSRDGEPFDELLQGILQQSAALLGSGDTCLVHRHNGEVRVAAGIGRFTRGDLVSEHLDAEKIVGIEDAIRMRRAISVEGCFTLPLHVGEWSFAIVHFEEQATDSIDLQLLHLFAHHASIAIQNAKLREASALDGSTGVYTRKFFEDALLRELRISHRTRQPVSVLRVLCVEPGQETAPVIKRSTRATDVLGYLGEGTFAIVLPNTDAAGASVVADRITRGMQQAAMRADIGGGVLSPPPENTQLSVPEHYFKTVAAEFIGRASTELSATEWPPI